MKQLERYLPELAAKGQDNAEELEAKANLAAELVRRYCNKHCWQKTGIMDNGRAKTEHIPLYRIFFYDCIPIQGEKVYPISGNRENFSKKPQAVFRQYFLKGKKGLLSKRKIALRLGKLIDTDIWVLRERVQKEIAERNGVYEQPRDSDFQLNIRQKGVDMRLGLDIASLAYKKQVSQIILVAGDSDFVPAVKLARREGIDIIVDSLGKSVSADMCEHIDGLFSHWRELPSILEAIRTDIQRKTVLTESSN